MSFFFPLWPFSLFSQLVVAPGSASPSSTLVELASEHLAGEIGASVKLRDSLENLLGVSSGDVVVAKLLPLSRRPVPIKDNKDGTYDAQVREGGDQQRKGRRRQEGRLGRLGEAWEA